MNTIFTRNDAREEKMLNDMRREHVNAVKEARAKVRKWEWKVTKFGGEVQIETLARMRANLEALR